MPDRRIVASRGQEARVPAEVGRTSDERRVTVEIL
jgi:hypothetical protein